MSVTNENSLNTTISWPAIAAIFADVVISPWNLLIGALLVSKLSIGAALDSLQSQVTYF